MRISKLFTFIVFYILTNLSIAQEIIITGTVTSEVGPLTGVNIIVPGTSIGNITDIDGKYTLAIPSSEVRLIFSYVGYKTTEEYVGNRTTIDVLMKVDVSQLDGVVVTGYSSQIIKNISGAVALIDTEEIKNYPASNIMDQMQGRAAGVKIIGSGRPGGPVSVSIRGYSTINDNNPLYIIDGMPVDWQSVSYLNPTDVASIQILKDASAASIYGARAANGVIIMTTKKGSGNGETGIHIDASFGVQQVAKMPDLLNPTELAEVIRLSKVNQGKPLDNPQYLLSDGSWGLPDYIVPTGHSIDLDGPVDESLYNYEVDTLRYTRANQSGTDWFEEIFQPGLIQNYNVSLTGGNEKGQFLFGLGYFDQEGVIIHSEYKRLSTRINTLFNIKNRVRIGENLVIAYQKSIRDVPNISDHNAAARSAPMWNAYQMPQILPVYDVAGNFAGPKAPGIGGVNNPVAQAVRNSNNLDESIRLMGSVFLEVDILKGLTFNTSFNPNYKLTFEHKFFRDGYIEGARDIQEALFQYSNNSSNWTWYNTLTYDRSFKDLHNLHILIGTESINNKITNFNASRSGYISTDISYRHLDAGESDFLNSGIISEWSLFSVFTKLDYDFKGKYILSGTVRRDGSSRFGEGNKYGVFPAFSTAWRISGENFMQSLDIINDLKFRFGWGQTGNQNIGDYGIYSTYSLDLVTANYDLRGTNNSVIPGYQSAVLGNPETKWETTTSTNVGLDLTMFKNSLSLNFDWYTRLTTDMLIQLPQQGILGQAESPYANLGEMINKGIDLALFYNSPGTRDFTWGTGINFSHYKNEVTKFYNDDYELYYGNSYTQEGAPIAQFKGLRILGIFQNEDEVINHANQEFNEPIDGVGRFKFADIDSSGTVDLGDETIIGNPHPDFTFGIPMNFSYRGFYLQVFWLGSFGNDIYNYSRSWTDWIDWPQYGQVGRSLLQSWGMPGVDKLTATLPLIVEESPPLEWGNNSMYIEDGSFIRLNLVTFGYTFNVEKWSAMKHLEIYFQGNNLLTITNYTGLDPSIPDFDRLTIGWDWVHYPNVRSYILGLKISL